MKFLKSTLAIAALFTVAFVNAKQTVKPGQPVVQVSEKTINEFVDNLLFDNDFGLTDVLLDNYNEQEACTFIKRIAQTITHEFPANPTAKRLFNEKMNEYFDNMTNNNDKMAMQNCAEKAMPMPSATKTAAPRSVNPARKTVCGKNGCRIVRK